MIIFVMKKKYFHKKCQHFSCKLHLNNQNENINIIQQIFLLAHTSVRFVRNEFRKQFANFFFRCRENSRRQNKCPKNRAKVDL